MNRLRILGLICLMPLLCFGDFAAEDKEIYQKLVSKLKGQGDTYKRSIRRIGDKTIELESFLAMEADPKLIPLIFSDFSRYGNWALPRINERPSGGKFNIHINKVESDPKDPSILKISFSLDIPLFRSSGQRDFKMKASSQNSVFYLSGEAVSQENAIIEGAKGIFKVFPAQGDPLRVWIYVKGSCKVRSWLLYEALPERLMERESGERILRIMENYQNEETRTRVQKPAARLDGIVPPQKER